MKNTFSSIRNYILAHKIIISVIFIGACYGGYKEYISLTSTDGESHYVIGSATKATIVSSISGSGQVSTENQIDLKPKASGDIVFLGVNSSGQEVKAGILIAQIDATEAQKTVRDAEANLESAQLSLEKLEQPPTELELTQSKNSLARTITSKQNAEDNLMKEYDDGFNDISNTFLDLPGVISGLHDLLYTPNSQLGGSNVNNVDYYSSSANLFNSNGAIYGADTNSKYQIALAKYNKNFQDFKSLTRTDSPAKIEAVINETYDTSLAAAEAVKSANNLIQFFEDQMTQNNKKVPALADTQLATLNGFTAKVNTHLSELLAVASGIKSDKNTIIDADRSIDESTQTLEKLKSGADALDLRGAQLTINQRRASLLDAKNTLADYYIRAPFDGVIAKLNSKKADSVSPSTVVATLITKQKIAQISLNEVDAAKIKVGQKATLTFDAIEGLSIAANVAEVDAVGTVSQGVVTYSVKLSFETQDDRVKSGMTVNAAIVTDIKQGVLSVPGSAVKSRGDTHYVLMIDGVTQASDSKGIISAIAPKEQVVEIGAANDSLTEVISGIKDGDLVVTRTIAPVTKVTTAAPSLIGGGGRTGGIRN